jgi:hypothetical protein
MMLRRANPGIRMLAFLVVLVELLLRHDPFEAKLNPVPHEAQRVGAELLHVAQLAAQTVQFGAADQ